MPPELVPPEGPLDGGGGVTGTGVVVAGGAVVVAGGVVAVVVGATPEGATVVMSEIALPV